MRRVEMPESDGVKIRILRVTEVSPVPVLIIGTNVHWLVQHWDGHGCRPCTSDPDNGKECKGCERHWPERVKGYLHVARSRENCILELTRDGAIRVYNACGGEEYLRGTTVNLWRQSGPKSALLASRLEREKPAVLPAEIDPAPHVEAFLNLDPRSRKRSTPENGKAHSDGK